MKLLNEKISKFLLWTGLILLGIGFLLFIWNESFFGSNQEIDSEKIGQFGDFVGGIVGSIWALAGVILFYVALTEQRGDMATNREVLKTQVNALEQQIQEFRLQREEIELTRTVFEEQSRTLKIQQFESTFFNSLNLLNNIIENIVYTDNPKVEKKNFNSPAFPQPDRAKSYYGRDSFEFFFEEFRSKYFRRINKEIKNFIGYEENERNIPKEIIEECTQIAYVNFFTEHQSHLGHYFRTLYNIIKLVKEKSPTNAKYYTNLVRAQLSSYEHLLLFYNCWSEFGSDKFKPLIIEFSLLDNMPKSLLLEKSHESFYPQEAYD